MNNDFIPTFKSKTRGSVFVLIFFMVLFTGCEFYDPSNLSSFDCSTCYQDKPDWGPLQIKVTINSQHPSVPLVIYRGDIESNDVEYIDTAYTSDYTVDVPVDQYYSVTAEYRDGEKTIYAVDGDELKLKKNATDCDEECYYFEGGSIDVILRN